MFAHTREAALAQLQDFIPASGKYSRDRNHVSPYQNPNVSRLSPAIRHRLITEEEAAAAPLVRYAPSTLEKYTQEVYWRRYWKSWLSLRPQVWHEYLAEHSSIQLSGTDQIRYQQAIVGKSGLAIMDLFTRELLETGYLHNHARMWWAGWWIHVARLPWQLGADFFYQNLLDADPASNTLSWRWVAGLQTPGKAYLPRRSNLAKYLPAEVLTEHSSGLEKLEHPQPFLPAEIPPKPSVTQPDLEPSRFKADLKTVFLIHEEDLSPETSPALNHAFDEIWCLADRNNWKNYQYSALKKTWTESALKDAQARTCQNFPNTTLRADILTLEAENIISELKDSEVQQISTLRPEVGRLATSLESLSKLWQESGGFWHWIDRPEDLTLRPLATAGFFGFWKKVQSKGLLPSKEADSQAELL
ncbi:MAG: FAD-binding domain-containing protein [Roseibacillus sp.]